MLGLAILRLKKEPPPRGTFGGGSVGDRDWREPISPGELIFGPQRKMAVTLDKVKSLGRRL